MLLPLVSTPAYYVSWVLPIWQHATELPAPPPRFKEAFKTTIPAEVLAQVQNQTTFAAALDLIARFARVSMVIEGNPHNPMGKKIVECVAELQKDGRPISIGALLSNLALLYDYQFSEKSGVLILEKHYTLPDDFPEISIQEMRTFFSAVVRITRSFTPDFPRQEGIDIRFQDFSGSLTSGQMELWKPRPIPQLVLRNPALERILAKSGRRPDETPAVIDSAPGIPFTSLNPVQQGFLRDLGLRNTIGKDVTNIGMAERILREINTDATRFFYRTFGGHNCFACEHPTANRTIFSPIAPVNRVIMNFDGGVVINIPLDGPDISEPTPADYDPDKKPLPRPFEVTTYSKTLKQFTEEASRTSGLMFTVHSDLEDKRINVINSDASDIPRMAQAVAALFNLRLIVQEKELNLDYPTVPKNLALKEIPNAIERVMPGPINRLYSGMIQAGYVRQLESFKIPYSERARHTRNQEVEISSGQEAMRREAIRRLRVLLDPLIKVSKAGSVYWNDLNDEARWLASYIFTCEAIPMACRQATLGIPDFISNPEDYVVVGLKYESQGRQWLRLDIRTTSGQPGFSDLGIVGKDKK